MKLDRVGVSEAEAARIKAVGLALELVENRLTLRDLAEPKQTPLEVDFLSGAVIHRLKQGSGKNQPLGRALGLRSARPEHAPFVFDATAGLGTDSFFIAALGCRVRGVERSPAVFALLEDGFRRLCRSVDAGETHPNIRSIASRLSFEAGDAACLLQKMDEADRPDVVYLDPMYPEDGRSKSALPKKSMQIFRRLVGDDMDATAVFEHALVKARERVVVKRPVHAPYLGGTPTHVFEGKTARYDMYLIRENQKL